MNAEGARFLWPAAFLVAFGLLNVYSASMPIAMEKYGDPMYFFKRQIFWVLISCPVFAAVARVPLDRWKTLAFWLFAITLAVLISMKLFGLGVTRNGASRWLKLGPLTFQPSEFAKPLLVVYLAKVLSADLFRRESRVIDYLSVLLVAGTLMGFVAVQPDFGGAVLLGLILISMIALAGAPAGLLASLLLIGLFVGQEMVFSSGYRSGRVMAFLDPWKDSQAFGFQLVQSYIAFGNGGLTGRGIGLGTQKLFYLPEAHTDFIFSVIGEEWGFLGAMLVLAAIAWLLYELFRLVIRSRRNRFAHLLAMGLFVALAAGFVSNLMVTTGLMPTKGLALPLLSYGGSALLSSSLMLGLFRRIQVEMMP